MKTWTEAENNLMRACYPMSGRRALQRLFRCDAAEIKRAALRLGLPRCRNVKSVSKVNAEFIRENYLKMTVASISEITGLSKTSVRTTAYSMGLKKLEMEYWPDEAVDFLEFVYPFLGDTEIAAYFDIHFPKNKGWSKKHIEKKRRYLNLKRTKQQLQDIQKRNVLTGCFADCAYHMWKTRGVLPVGTVVVRKYPNGAEYAEIKTENGFVHRNPWLWQQHNGPVPDGMVVTTKPGAPVVCQIDDLVLKSRYEMRVENYFSDTSIVKRFFGIKNDADVQAFIKAKPELIELKRKTMQLNGQIRKITKRA